MADFIELHGRKRGVNHPLTHQQALFCKCKPAIESNANQIVAFVLP